MKAIKIGMNPLTNWTVVVNFYNGDWPSDADYAPTIPFMRKLTDMLPDLVEVRSPHKVAVDKASFPAPETGHTTTLPSDWREKRVES